MEIKANKRRRLRNLVVLLLIATAVLCRILTHNDFITSPSLSYFLSLLRTSIYIGIYITWIISIKNRIIDKKTRNLLMAIGVLAICWFMFRTYKYYFVQDPLLKRYLWYLYYIPLMFMPTLCMLVAGIVDKAEHWRFPKWVHATLLIPVFLGICILLNEFHQCAFRFLTPERSESHIAYGWLYWAAAGWSALCGFAGLVILLKKCRIPHSKHFLVMPFIPAVISFLYCVGYTLDLPLIDFISKDITAFLCLFFIATMECCIQCGLIRSNSNYDELFTVSSLHALITDRKFQIKLSSNNNIIPTLSQMERTRQEAIILDSGIRLSSSPIKDGYVLWMEDLSELTDVLSDLEDVNTYLKGERKVLEKENETTREQQKVVEKNRLYNKIMTKTNAQIEHYYELVEQLDQATDPKEIQYLVSRIAVVCTYIKRRDNMIFLDEASEENASREMNFCLEETKGALKLCGVECIYEVNLDGEVAIGKIAHLYELIYQVIMETLDAVSFLLIYINEEEHNPALTIRLVCDPKFQHLEIPGAEVEQDGNSWIVSAIVSK